MNKKILDLSRGKKRGGVVKPILVASMLIFCALYVVIVGEIEYLHQALDSATQKAAREVSTGAIQKSSESQSSFRLHVCSYLPNIFNCDKLIVNLYTITAGTRPVSYRNFIDTDLNALTIPDLNPRASMYQPGTQGSYQYLQVIYPITFIPTPFDSMLSAAIYNGAPTRLAISTAAFRNEQY